jgi:hypothetical protein
MTKSARSLALIAGLSLLPFTTARDDDEIRKARKDVLDVAADLEAGKDVKARVAAIRKKYEELNPIMIVFKPPHRGGLSAGPREKDDGIEKKLHMLAKRELSEKELEKARGDLVKAGWVSVAVARITHAYAPPEKKGEDRGPKEWRLDLEAMEKASKRLIDAAKAGDPAAVKKAATAVNASCNNCHTVFRDA